MIMDKKTGCQDAFLDYLVKNSISVYIFLINGVRLQGSIIKSDKFSILLLQDGRLQLIYKGAVATIMPSLPIVLFEEIVDDMDE